jgi:hypothetical protein
MRNSQPCLLVFDRTYCTHNIAFEGESIAKMYIGNWSDYEEMMMEKFGKDLQPHRVKYGTFCAGDIISAWDCFRRMDIALAITKR